MPLYEVHYKDPRDHESRVRYYTAPDRQHLDMGLRDRGHQVLVVKQHTVFDIPRVLPFVAWDEGYAAGRDDEGRYRTDDHWDDADAIANPYLGGDS